MPRNARIQLNSLKKMLAVHGDHVIWTAGVPCPCRAMRGAADMTCLMCGGTGVWWDDTRRLGIKVLVLPATIHRELSEQGQMEEGDLVVGQPLSRPHLSVHDRIELRSTDGEAFEGEVRPKLNGMTILSYQPVEVTSVLSGDPRTGIVTNYSFIASEATHSDDPTVYDCTFRRFGTDGTASRAIYWNPNRGPVDQTLISVRYRAQFEYVVVDVPTYPIERDNDLGQAVVLRLKHRAFATVPDNPRGAEPATQLDRAILRPAWE